MALLFTCFFFAWFFTLQDAVRMPLSKNILTTLLKGLSTAVYKSQEVLFSLVVQFLVWLWREFFMLCSHHNRVIIVLNSRLDFFWKLLPILLAVTDTEVPKKQQQKKHQPSTNKKIIVHLMDKWGYIFREHILILTEPMGMILDISC